MIEENPDYIRLSDVPSSVLEQQGRLLYTYTIGLIIEKEGEKEVFQTGSGVLIDINGTRGILTAKHVSESIKQNKDGKLGLLLYENNSHRTTIDISLLSFQQFSIENNNDQYFPDISFISLPSNFVPIIGSIKSFYNLAFDRDLLLSLKDDYSEGIWYVCGFPEWGSFQDIGPVFNREISIFGICGATGVVNSYDVEGYDFYEVIVDYNTSNKEVPKNFGGISGGGLWKATFGEEFVPKDYFLCGLIISQSSIDNNNQKKLICLGRKSLYEKFFSYLNSMY